MELELRRINLWPLFRNIFLVSALLFLILFIFMGNMIIQVMNQSMSDMGMGTPSLSGPLSFFTLLWLSISNAFFFSLLLTAAGALYNFITHWTGGITLEFTDLYEDYDDFYTEENVTEDDVYLNKPEEGTDKE